MSKLSYSVLQLGHLKLWMFFSGLWPKMSYPGQSTSPGFAPSVAIGLDGSANSFSLYARCLQQRYSSQTMRRDRPRARQGVVRRTAENCACPCTHAAVYRRRGVANRPRTRPGLPSTYISKVTE